MLKKEGKTFKQLGDSSILIQFKDINSMIMNENMLKNTFKVLMSCLILTTGTVKAQIDTIRVKDKRLMTSVLKPGLKQYLVYYQSPKNTKNLRFWFWTRNIQKQTRNGAPVFTISQQWFGNDTTSYRAIYSVNRATDFAPVYHMEATIGKKRAYNWSDSKITGADTVNNNIHKTFSLDFSSPNFNWNLDIETFEMLPLKAGKTFAINFYDAALEPPKYVLYKVSGSEILATLDNKKVDCWKLYTEGSGKDGTYTQTFWISKKQHEFLKAESFYAGLYGYKIKLPEGAPDFPGKFIK